MSPGGGEQKTLVHAVHHTYEDEVEGFFVRVFGEPLILFVFLFFVFFLFMLRVIFLLNPRS